MATEIERKFLVSGESWRQHADAGTAIRQGYLCAEKDRTVRLRLTATGATLTIKGAGAGIARSEYEYAIPRKDGQEMLDTLCVGAPIAKTRYRVEYSGHVWEIDLFEGANAGLVLAEVELDSADEAVDLPGWAGREVSEDERYYNAYLTRHPFGSWSA
ncbi:MAG: CYTH domain-containing protein [Gammaproteobacteria bacterium]|jgi:CYTH domain-containing protein|nr:CYTH domain-containing protein [Gammaproteobacteria bacterium]